MSRQFKKDESRLQIRWRAREHYFDIFSADFFATETEEEIRKHGMFYKDNKDELSASCVATIKGDFAFLKYRDHPENVEEGDLLIYFTSSQRDEVRKIDWQPLDGKLLENHGMSNWDISSEAEEGRERTREAKYLSRNRELVEQRKRKDNNKCQACGYKLKVDDSAIIDVHHTNPIALGARTTSIEDLICLCPNCHRIAHTSNPPRSVESVKSLLPR